jgi:hypothetical protein
MEARLAMTVCSQLLAVSLLALPIELAHGQNGEKKFSLQGQVVDGVTGRPLAGVEIGLDGIDWEPAAEPATPDAQGRFVFHGLAAGQYILFASRPDFGRIFFDEVPDSGVTQTVHIKPEQTVKTVLFRVMSRSAVSGTVRDEFSDPVEYSNVILYRAAWIDGRVRLQPGERSTTDDRGRYRISNVPPGGYFVCASPGGTNNGGGNVAPSAGPVDFASRAEPRFYIQTCLPNASGSPFTPLQLSAGRQTEINLTLRSASASSLRGRLLNLPPGVSTGIRLVPEDAFHDAQPLFSGTAAEGKFMFRGVLPGRYRLEADFNWQPPNSPLTHLVARVPVEIGGTNLEGVDVPLEPPAVIDVVFRGAEPAKAEAQTIEIGLRSSSESSWAQRESKGPLRFASLFAGSYWLFTRTTKTTCVQSAKLGEQDALRSAVTVKWGTTAQLDVTLSKDCGEIQGRVVSDGIAQPNAKVLILISGSAKEPGNMLTDHTDDEGEFSLNGLAPGRYLLWAWREDAGGSSVGPASLGSVEGQATSVLVTKGEAVKIDVALLQQEKPK